MNRIRARSDGYSVHLEVYVNDQWIGILSESIVKEHKITCLAALIDKVITEERLSIGRRIIDSCSSYLHEIARQGIVDRVMKEIQDDV